ncbi:GNAT family N-acetyltransferase [Alteromonas gracilis]|uniref:GNAT family N-acetyltransferase n=1 Tax=Alteromonas gracilis TaxID=1479524 RepID=UPI0030CF0499
MKKGDGIFELTKMGVVSSARGLKVGEALLKQVIEQAPLIAHNTLFLLTNKKCEAAIHLYDKNGLYIVIQLCSNTVMRTLGVM